MLLILDIIFTSIGWLGILVGFVFILFGAIFFILFLISKEKNKKILRKERIGSYFEKGLKLIFLFLVILAITKSVFVSFRAKPPGDLGPVGPPSALTQKQIYFCNQETDCEVKNVGNCCGYYPKCVNKSYQPDLQAVKEKCKETGSMGVCGYPEIDYCECNNNQCVSRQKRPN